MEKPLQEIGEQFSFIGALISTAAGIVSIVKDSPWYIYTTFFVLSLFLIVYVILTTNKSQEDFEIIWEESIIDINDDQGKQVIYKTEEILKARKAKSQEFLYTLSSDGSISDIELSQGIIDNQYVESGVMYIKTLTRSPISKGEQLKRTLSCKMTNSFVKHKEYWEIMRYAPKANVRVVIIFPHNRKFTECKAYRILGKIKEFTEKQPLELTVDNRPALVFEIKQSKASQKYRIEWTW